MVSRLPKKLRLPSSFQSEVRTRRMREAEGDPLDRLDDDEMEALSKRLRLSRLLEKEEVRSRELVEAAAEIAGVHPSTVYRDLRRLEGRGTIRALAPRQRGFPAGRSRLHIRQDEIIEHLLRTYYLTEMKPSLVSAVERIGDQCEKEGFTRPSRVAVMRRLARLPMQQVVLKREGAKAAHGATPHPGRLEIERPWEMYQIDHTLADVVVLDSTHLKPIGRPWLTLVMDVFSRMVVGFWVALDPPSILRAGTAMDLAVRPKEEWLVARGLNYPWPTSGLPRIVHSDNGSDFRSSAFRRALLNQGVQPKFRQRGKTHHGAHIERLIGHFMGRCRLLPGKTERSPLVRGHYDSNTSARVTLDDLETWFAHEILGRYHNKAHAGLNGQTPMDVWLRGVAGRAPEFPDDLVTFRLDLFPEEWRVITPQGISLFREEYYSQELGEAFIAGTRQVRVKYDPRDLREIYVGVPGGFISVPQRFPGRGPAAPLWLSRAARKSLPPALHGSRAAMRQAEETAEAILEQAAERHSRPRRQAERLRQSRLSAAIDKAGRSRGVDEIAEDDWGGAFSDDASGAS